jgi:hypothetical protein
MLTPYPDSFPADSIKSLMTMIRDKNVDKEALGLAIWNLQGYAQSKLLSNNPVRFSASSNPNPSDEDAMEALTTLHENIHTLKGQSSGTVVNPQIVSMGPVLSVALSVLLKWALNKAIANL